jgi:hypothetical protein
MNAHDLPNWLIQAETKADSFHAVPKAMRDANRWLVHRKKQPFYVDGTPRSGSLAARVKLVVA